MPFSMETNTYVKPTKFNYGPIFLFHFSPKHELIKMTLLKKRDYETGDKWLPQRSAWILVGDSLYGYAGMKEEFEGHQPINKICVYTYNTITTECTTSVYDTDPSISVFPLEDRLLLATNMIYDPLTYKFNDLQVYLIKK